MKYYIVCNWKMNPASFDRARELIFSYNKLFHSPRKREKANKIEAIVCPPFLYFQLLDEKRSKAIKLGAQNIFWTSSGNHTGQISAKMIRDFGGEFVLIGHSELRRVGDDDKIVNAKAREALKKNLTPIVCVGFSDLAREVRNIVNNFSAEEVNSMIFAYEPVEAVGTGKAVLSERVKKATYEIRKIIYRRFKRRSFWGLVQLGGKKHLIPHPPILYGGSVDNSNCSGYIEKSDIDGFVIGKESLNPEGVKKIVKKIENS